MDIHGILPERVDSGGVDQFVPDVTDYTDERSKAMANPLALHNKIGDSVIDFVSTFTIIHIFTCVNQPELSAHYIRLLFGFWWDAEQTVTRLAD